MDIVRTKSLMFGGKFSNKFHLLVITSLKTASYLKKYCIIAKRVTEDKRHRNYSSSAGNFAEPEYV